jgi:SAM-dependent methyltransferase
MKMGNQENIFAESEGDAWFARNWLKIEDQAKNDPVLALIKNNISPKRMNVLEFGCSNGWRLNAIKGEFPCGTYGVDPSAGAVANGAARFPKVHLKRGTMTSHQFGSASMGLVIYGFCLYVCDPEELPEIVTQGDNVLADGGYLVIHDFDAEFPHSVPNHHVPGLMTYKMDWSRLWLANPAYSLVAKQVIPDGTAVWILKKDQKGAFPCLSPK